MYFTAPLPAVSALPSPRRRSALFDDGALYSAIGIVEFRLLSDLMHTSTSNLEPKPSAIASFD